MHPARTHRNARLAAATVLVAVALSLAVLPAGAASAQPLSAHPLGNFSVNRYDGLVVTPDQLRIDHVQDFAEIPAAQLHKQVDDDRDEVLTTTELRSWARPRCRTAAGELTARVGERPVNLTLHAATAESREGQAGLRTLRLECTITAALPRVSDAAQLVFIDRATGDGIAWREISARAERIRLTRSDVPTRSVSNRLLAYPKDLLKAPLNQRVANLTLRRGATQGETPETDQPSHVGTVLPRGADKLTAGFMSMISRQDLTFGIGVVALAAAVLLGALHAVAPGHGKTIMAAYAAGRSDHSLRAVLALGVTVTVTHTAGVFVLALVVTAGTTFAPHTLFPWFAAASGVLVTLVGLTLFRRARAGWAHVHHHIHGHGHGHSHADHHVHEHGHVHATAHATTPTRERGSIVLMGIAGGMVPSPSAIVVLLGAAALGHAWFGILLVLAYGAGMALTLTLAGLLVVRLSEQIRERLLTQGRATWMRAIPTATSLLVIVLGLVLTARGIASALSPQPWTG